MSKPIKGKVQDHLADLKTLRDEIGLDLHLASMELRDEWREIEKKLPDPAAAAGQLKDLTSGAIEALCTQLRSFRGRLRQSGENGPSAASREGGPIARIMTRSVATCAPSDTLARAVTTMWDRDVGCLPVVGAGGQLLGIITDRDAAIAACTRGQRMDEITVDSAMSRDVLSCRPDDGIEQALALMRSRKVRRLPVVSDGALVGLVSVNDAARALVQRPAEAAHSANPAEIAVTLAAICEPRARAGGVAR
jgi:CBS domain-containing protein